jgi:hypothetical protein
MKMKLPQRARQMPPTVDKNVLVISAGMMVSDRSD